MSRGARRSARDVILARRALFLGAALGGVMAPSRAAAQPVEPADGAEPSDEPPEPSDEPPAPSDEAPAPSDEPPAQLLRAPLPCPAGPESDEDRAHAEQIAADESAVPAPARLAGLEQAYRRSPSTALVPAMLDAAVAADAPTAVMRLAELAAECEALADLRPRIAETLAATRDRAATITFELVGASPGGVVVHVDDEPVADPSLPVRIDPGSHQVRIDHRTTGSRSSHTIEAAPGDTYTLRLAAVPQVCLSPPPEVCLSVVPYGLDRRGPAFALGGSLPALVSLAEDASPYFLGGQLDAIFHFGIARLIDWRLAGSGAALGGRDGVAGAVGGWTGLRLTPEQTPLMFGLGVASGYLFLPDMLSAGHVPISSPYLAPYVSPIGAHFDALESELRVSLWLTEQASPADTRFAPSFVQVSFWVGYGFYGDDDESFETATARPDDG